MASSSWKLPVAGVRPQPEALVAEWPNAKGNLLQNLKKLASKWHLKNPFVVGFPVAKGNLTWVKFLVPKDDALPWMKRSGCEDVFFRRWVRPGEKKSDFSVKWLKGHVDSKFIWTKLSNVESFGGLALSQKSVGVRIIGGGSQSISQALGEGFTKLKDKVEGLTWWKIDKLDESELFHVDTLIEALGLQLFGGVRKSRRGKYWRVIFQAKGTPHAESHPDVGSKAILTLLSPDTDAQSSTMMESGQEHPPLSVEDPLVPLKQEMLELKEQMGQLVAENQVLKEKVKEQEDKARNFSELSVTLSNLATVAQEFSELKNEAARFKDAQAEFAELRKQLTELQQEHSLVKAACEVFGNFIPQCEDFRKSTDKRLRGVLSLYNLVQKDVDKEKITTVALKTSLDEAALKVQNLSEEHSKLHEDFWNLMTDLPPDDDSIIGEKQIRTIITEAIESQTQFHRDFPLPSAAGRGRSRGR